jgi:hypothetical protein
MNIIGQTIQKIRPTLVIFSIGLAMLQMGPANFIKIFLSNRRWRAIFTKKGKFIHWKYSLFLKSITYLIPIIRGIVKGIVWLLSFIPYLGNIIKSLKKDFMDGL